MTLIKQLWLAVLFSTLLAFSGSLFISIWTARGYLSEQLERKNSDNANSLALSMTQQSKDEVMVELQVSALFDTGFYREVSVFDPQQRIISQRVQTKIESEVPDWFINFFPIPSPPGVAQVNDGWKQYATVVVVSHNQFAHRALWLQAGTLIFWFSIGGGLAGVLGMLVVNAIGRSLRDVVFQAEAIGERRFIKISEPQTPELKALASAMNTMVERVRQMFTDEAEQLELLQRKVNYDELTGLPNRDYFMAHFKHQLTSEEAAKVGGLMVLRLPDLDELNDSLGRQGTDLFLGNIGAVLDAFANQNGGMAGRVKAGDFAFIIPGNAEYEGFELALGHYLSEHLIPKWPQIKDLFHVGVTGYTHGEALGEALARADQAVAVAQTKGMNAFHTIRTEFQTKGLPGEGWRTLLTQAATGGNLHLVFYPVKNGDGEAMHQEGMIRLRNNDGDGSLSAADFMPIAARLNLTAAIDLEVIKLGLEHLKTITEDIAINLSAETVSNWGFRSKLATLLQSYPDLCKRMWFEVPEYGAFKQFDAFKDLCRALKSLGCRVGIEFFGEHMSETNRLVELGLDYIKIHPSLIDNLSSNPGNQEFLKRFCDAAHGLGILVIGVGVRSSQDWAVLNKLGADAATGPAVG